MLTQTRAGQLGKNLKLHEMKNGKSNFGFSSLPKEISSFQFSGLCKVVVQICFGFAVPVRVLHAQGDGNENKVEGKFYKRF